MHFLNLPSTKDRHAQDKENVICWSRSCEAPRDCMLKWRKNYFCDRIDPEHLRQTLWKRLWQMWNFQQSESVPKTLTTAKMWCCIYFWMCNKFRRTILTLCAKTFTLLEVLYLGRWFMFMHLYGPVWTVWLLQFTLFQEEAICPGPSVKASRNKQNPFLLLSSTWCLLFFFFSLWSL